MENNNKNLLKRTKKKIYKHLSHSLPLPILLININNYVLFFNFNFTTFFVATKLKIKKLYIYEEE